jgi:ectoine hydroxylase-related dioxygenase (phytanoyl-CoA dioxygenase family)
VSLGPQRYLTDKQALNLPWVESPFFERLLAAEALDPVRERQARDFHRQGYLVVEDLFAPQELDAVLERYAWMFDPATRFDAAAHVVEVLTRDPNRRQDAWFVCPPVAALATHEKVLELLRFLYGREPIPFQTLNFLRGSQQPLHSDAVHFSALPARFMCGVWVALEDVDLDNGPLMYAEGSHALDDRQMYELHLWPSPPGGALGENYALYEDYVRAVLASNAFPVKSLSCKKGTLLVWASNLLHGGAPITEPGQRAGRTRKSQVTHYYFHNCVYYTPVYSNPAAGQYYLRDVYDIARRTRVPHRVNGCELPESVLRAMRAHWVPGPSLDRPVETPRPGLLARLAHKLGMAQ